MAVSASLKRGGTLVSVAALKHSGVTSRNVSFCRRCSADRCACARVWLCVAVCVCARACDGVWLSVTLYACRSKRWVSFGTGTLQVGPDRHLPFYQSFTHTKLTSCRGPDYIHLATVVEPHLQHCFVLGLGHLMDHNATCSGNDVPQLLRDPHGFGIRHVPRGRKHLRDDPALARRPGRGEYWR